MYIQTAEHIAKRKESRRRTIEARGYLYSKEVLDRISKANKGKVMTAEERKKRSDALVGRSYKDLYGDRAQGEALKRATANKGSKRTAEQIQNISKAHIGQTSYWKGKKRTFPPSFGEKVSRALKGRKRHPEELRKALQALCKHPNKFEVRALAYMDLLYPGRFSFCGDGSIIINGRSPDAIDPKTRTVALFNGTYWHLGKHGLPISDDAKGAVELIEAQPFIEYGYRVIFIWEDEI